MIFMNECNCIVDEELLTKAVDTYCRRNNVYCNEKHRITLHNNYPTIIISRKHLYVHDLLRMIMFRTRKGYVVHHADFNKLNNTAENLMYISMSKHTRIHSNYNWQKIKTEKIRVKRPIRRKDITEEKIMLMLKEGKTLTDIAKHFGCHRNTIHKRIQNWKGVKE